MYVRFYKVCPLLSFHISKQYINRSYFNMQEIEFTAGKMKSEESPNNAVTFLQNEDREQCK